MRCLFCKKPSHNSKSVEHIIPESVGNKKRVLPRGAVCDKCNNYFATKVESPVLSHPSFRNVRAWWSVPSKKRKYPSLVGMVAGADIAVALHHSGKGDFRIKAEKEKDQQRLDAFLDKRGGMPPPVLFSLSEDPPEYEMSRFLAKMALEGVFELFSREPGLEEMIIDEPHFDRIRNFARYGANFKEWPIHQRRIFPDDTLMRHPKTNEWVQVGFGYNLMLDKRREMFFAFGLYGMEYVINVGGPSIFGYEEWLAENGNISPLVELAGTTLVSREEGRKKRFYLEKNHSPHPHYRGQLKNFMKDWLDGI